MKLELIAATTFGLEAPARREIEKLGYRIIRSEDGKITFSGDERAIVRANLWLRCADRVQIKMAEFEALEFEDLFQQVKAIPWEQWIPPEGKFIVNGSSVKSKLSSVPACQSVSEKAIIEKLKETYAIDHFEKSGALYDIKITILKDRVTVTLDTTGPSLHKRGYRTSAVVAPIKETLAAAMIELSFWRADRIMVDTCCGSGTLPIEAAMIGRNMAPGVSRHFASEDWEAIPEELWKEERKKAFEAVDWETPLKIYAYDIDKKAIEAAAENATEAGVIDDIVFRQCDSGQLCKRNELVPFCIDAETGCKREPEGGIIITNPPYGERIGDRTSIDNLYGGIRKFLSENPTWSCFAITADKSIEEKVFKRPADRRRKLFNGRLEVCYYQYHGQKPDKSKNALKAE